jgi:hypothetical protein
LSFTIAIKSTAIPAAPQVGCESLDFDARRKTLLMIDPPELEFERKDRMLLRRVVPDAILNGQDQISTRSKY